MLILTVIFALIVLTSCTQLEPQESEVILDLDLTEQSKSQYPLAFSVVYNCSYLIYHDGLLEAQGYVEDGTRSTFRLFKGVKYNIYAIANAGRIEGPANENDLKNLHINAPLPEISCNMPFSGFIETEAGNNTIYIPISPLMSMINLNIDRTSLDRDSDCKSYFTVDSVVFEGASSKIYPFGQFEDDESRIVDKASAFDLVSLNYAGSASFYVCGGKTTMHVYSNYSVTERPSPAAIRTLEEKVKYHFHLGDESGLANGKIYSSTIIPGTYGGSQNCSTVEKESVRDESVFISICNSKGIPCQKLSFPGNQAGNEINIYYRIYPEDSDGVTLSCDNLPYGVMLSSYKNLTSTPGLYFDCYRNYFGESSSSYQMDFTLNKYPENLVCHAHVSWAGKEETIEDFEDGGDQTIDF